MRESRTRQAAGATPGTTSIDEMYQRLGLEPGVPGEDVAQVHDELVAFLATAPRSLRGWAHVQAAHADEAYAYLTDAAAGRTAGPDALVGSGTPVAMRPGGPDRLPVRQAAPAPAVTAAAAAPAAPAALSEDDQLDALIASVTPSAHRETIAEPAPAAAGPARRRTVTLTVPGRRVLLAVGGVAVLGVVLVAGYGFGNDGAGGTSGTDQTAQGSAAPGIDTAKVAMLMERVSQDPKDADALLGIGDEYFTVGDYQLAIEWFQKAAAVDPSNVKTYLALGAAMFNGGDPDGAEMQWTRAVELDPSSVEAHYDLGFLYLNREPPDMAGVQREWREVVRLAPGSDIAETVQTHLGALASPAPGAGGAPAASSGPAAPAASTAPAASQAPAAPAGSPAS